MAWTTPRDWVGGEFVTEAIMDTHVRDNLLAVGPHLVVRKTADESVTSNITVQADDVLILPVGVSEIWRFNLDLLVQGATAGDFRMNFTFPAGGTISYTVLSANSAGAVTAELVASTTTPTAEKVFEPISATIPSFIQVQGVYVNAGTGGNVTLQWAQGTSSGTATTVKANSTLWAVKLA